VKPTGPLESHEWGNPAWRCKNQHIYHEPKYRRQLETPQLQSDKLVARLCRGLEIREFTVFLQMIYAARLIPNYATSIRAVRVHEVEPTAYREGGSLNLQIPIMADVLVILLEVGSYGGP
jgi:hypothetical protein